MDLNEFFDKVVNTNFILVKKIMWHIDIYTNFIFVDWIHEKIILNFVKIIYIRKFLGLLKHITNQVAIYL